MLFKLHRQTQSYPAKFSGGITYLHTPQQDVFQDFCVFGILPDFISLFIGSLAPPCGGAREPLFYLYFLYYYICRLYAFYYSQFLIKFAWHGLTVNVIRNIYL